MSALIHDPVITLPDNPLQWIEDLGKPSWDAYFMSMVFLAAMRSPDQETKQGCVIVDWATKTPLGTGYNGHPRNAAPFRDVPTLGRFHSRSDVETAMWKRDGKEIHELPTKRPGKYKCMVHADTNAVVNCRGSSDNAVVYLPMPPCEVCLGVMANLPTVKICRIVYLEYRQFPATEELLAHLPHIFFEKYQGEHPANVLLNAATYAKIRTTAGEELSKQSSRSYSAGAS